MPSLQAEEITGVHAQTKECRQSEKVLCLYACKYCHDEPWHPIEFYDLDTGDRELCTKCHSGGKGLVKSKDGTDCIDKHHADNLYYIRNSDQPGRTELNDRPTGLKLFCDPDDLNRCRVFCISCHNPMDAPGERLRIKQRIQLCKRCHPKEIGKGRYDKYVPKPEPGRD